VYVVIDEGRVVGYHALCAYSVGADTAPSGTRLGRLDVPAILLARLAVDKRHQGRGLGEHLLLDGLLRAAQVADAIGAKLMVVHALHEPAARFYLRSGFRRFESQPLHLYLPMRDVRRTLSALNLLDGG
jgi:GNAT superfamily N-acetyltransferase